MIRKFLRAFVIQAVGLWFVSSQIGGIEFSDSFNTLIYASIGLTLVELILRPVINLMLLPLNLITLGTFRWVTNVLILYLVTILVTGFSITAFTFKGFQTGALIIPEIYLSKFMAFIVISFVLSIITSFFFWLSGGGGRN